MKLSHMFDSLPKRFFAALTVALAFALPTMSLAAETVQIEGIMGVANVTNGDTAYKETVDAKVGQVVKYQIFYRNKEAADSGKVAKNLNVKVNVPAQAGKTQKATVTIKADNSNTVTSSTTVNLDNASAYLQYIPGSAVWRHRSGDSYTDTKVSDQIVNGGTTLGDVQPGDDNAQTVTILARVVTNGVKFTKQVENAGETDKWSGSNTANPGDTVLYRLSYQNSGSSTQNAVVISDTLPKNVSLVPGSTHVIVGSKDVADDTNHIASGGLDLGNYEAGAGVTVTFEAKLPTADKLDCGDTTLSNIGAVQPKDLPQYFGTATTVVTKKCAPANPAAPVYSCNAFDFKQGDNRTITITKFDTTAKNGATFKDVVIDWGDDSDQLTTDKAVGKTHTYAKDGAYTVAATAHFTVNGQDKAAPVGTCTKVATFTGSAPSAPAAPSGSEPLPNTGAGSVIGLFSAAAILGVVAHRLFLNRRLSRQ
ncbi:MAG TPA: DUF11 domain-containing protein [Candidatus Saccharimonadales bacterium]|nr:DUF11 domain-containing protein [Candidatus Saccharimonadales bacterium]